MKLVAARRRILGEQSGGVAILPHNLSLLPLFVASELSRVDKPFFVVSNIRPFASMLAPGACVVCGFCCGYVIWELTVFETYYSQNPPPPRPHFESFAEVSRILSIVIVGAVGLVAKEIPSRVEERNFAERRRIYRLPAVTPVRIHDGRVPIP